MVVIMIGRKRTRHASRMAASALTLGSFRASIAKSTIMMPFFLTRPTSRITPDECVHVELVTEDEQRHQRAEAGERQRREDGERMEQAFVEDAEHEIDHEHRDEEQRAEPGERRLERLGRALEARGDAAGQHLCAPHVLRARPPRSASDPGFTLNDTVAAGSWPEWLTESGPTPRVMSASEASGTSSPRPSARRAARARSDRAGCADRARG